MWPIVEATLDEEPSGTDRLLPWRRLPVTLRLGMRQEVSVPALVSQLSAVLRENQAFCDQLRISADRFVQALERAESAAEILDLVRAHLS
jgi:hypothetical protein